MEYRNERLELRRLSLTADKLIERSEYHNKDYKKLLVEIDLLLYYISKTKSNIPNIWYPVTYIYKEEFSSVEIISKMVRKKYFDDIKCIFNVDDRESMIELINSKMSQPDRGFSGGFRDIPMIQSSIKVEEIATL